MASLLQDLEILDEVGTELVEFAEGQPVSANKTIGKVTIDAQFVKLGATPDPSYQEFSGSFFNIVGLVLTDATAIAAGQPVKIQEKVGNTWYGETFTVTIAA